MTSTPNPNANPDPHGQAALMLVESLLLLLVEQGILQKEQVIEAIEGVVEIKQEIAGRSESVVVSMVSIGLLRAVALSVSAASPPMGPVAIP
jgi:hypothetical protein